MTAFPKSPIDSCGVLFFKVIPEVGLRHYSDALLTLEQECGLTNTIKWLLKRFKVFESLCGTIQSVLYSHIRWEINSPWQFGVFKKKLMEAGLAQR